MSVHSTHIAVEALDLDLRHVFRIAHGSSTRRTNALFRLTVDGHGPYFGEAALPPYYPYHLEHMVDYVRSLDLSTLDVHAPRSFLTALPDGPGPARAAIDMAVHDAWGTALGTPLYKLFGLDPRECPVSSYALPIPDDLPALDGMLDEVLHFPFLKLKVGSGNVDFDEAVVRRTRERFAGTLCIDVNAGWSIPEAVRLIPKLADVGLAFIEQPIAAQPCEDWLLLRRLMRDRSTPLVADESVQGRDTLFELAGAADGINIKLAKCGGIHAALDMVALARSLDMRLMLGCMIESNVAMTAAAHIAPLFDWLDLDGPMHLSRDPFTGMTFQEGHLTVPDLPGLGVRPTSS